MVDCVIGLQSLSTMVRKDPSSNVSEDDRISDLAAISKDLILRSSSDEKIYLYVRSMLLAASDSV